MAGCGCDRDWDNDVTANSYSYSSEKRQPARFTLPIGQVTVVDMHLPFPEGWRRMTDEEGKEYQKQMEKYLDGWSIVALETRALVGPGYDFNHKSSYGSQCGQCFIINPSKNNKEGESGTKQAKTGQKLEQTTQENKASSMGVIKASDPVPKGWRKLAADECFIIRDPLLQEN